VVLLLGQLFGGLGAQPPSWAVAGATLTVAALSQPARRRIQTGEAPRAKPPRGSGNPMRNWAALPHMSPQRLGWAWVASGSEEGFCA
jgi:hypothetical protein